MHNYDFDALNDKLEALKVKLESFEAKQLQARKEWHKRYDANRTDNTSRHKAGVDRIIDRSNKGGTFIGIDSEGININAPEKDGNNVFQDQRTCLWMAGGAAEFEYQSLVDPKGLTSERIFEWLLSLPRKFQIPGKPRAIFVGFGFGYDAAMIVKDLPYEKVWELHHGKPYEERDNPDYPENLRRVVLWGKYGIYYIPRKVVCLYRLRDHNHPFKRENKGGGKITNVIDAVDRVQIYDTFGFFQERLTGAIEKMPDILSLEEKQTIKAGKDARGSFKVESLETEIKPYTSLELKALAAMMEKLRTSLREAIKEKPIELRDWYGAGAIAKALLDAYLPQGNKEYRAILGNVEEDTPQREWALYAYFGGRIELAKQGKHQGKIWTYDVASAYPSILIQLPNMKGGRWEYVTNPTRGQVESANILSMFRLKTHAFEDDLPFYPLPQRLGTGSILLPGRVFGRYMRDHVIVAFKWFDEFERRGRLCNRGLHPQGPSIELIDGWLFHPATDDRPLAWIANLFNYRATLAKDDVRSTVIKLGINSVYGAMAQRVGQRGKPPKYASPWFAAATTAGTQRKLIEAALADPDAIVAFATDGIYSKRDLKLYCPTNKTLGEWELKIAKSGAAFVQSGVYTIHKDDEAAKLKDRLEVKSRGFSPQNLGATKGMTYTEALDDELYKVIPTKWQNGEAVHEFRYQQFIGIGQAVVSRKAFKNLAKWKVGPRELQLDTMSNKRGLSTNKQFDKSARSRKLVDLLVRPMFDYTEESYPSHPDWLSEATRREHEIGEDAANIAAGFS